MSAGRLLDTDRLTEADLDARELERISEPIDLDAPGPNVGAGTHPRHCGAQPPTTWRQILEAELTHTGRWALYAGVLLASIVASWLWPMPWWGPQ